LEIAGCLGQVLAARALQAVRAARAVQAVAEVVDTMAEVD
jgi:hypothetical protein